MSLLFGDLTQSFVNFTAALSDPEPAKLAAAKYAFEAEAAKGALYLTFIGKTTPSHLDRRSL
jgi:hypothetical protein